MATEAKSGLELVAESTGSPATLSLCEKEASISPAVGEVVAAVAVSAGIIIRVVLASGSKSSEGVVGISGSVVFY